MAPGGRFLRVAAWWEAARTVPGCAQSHGLAFGSQTLFSGAECLKGWPPVKYGVQRDSESCHDGTTEIISMVTGVCAACPQGSLRTTAGTGSKWQVKRRGRCARVSGWVPVLGGERVGLSPAEEAEPPSDPCGQTGPLLLSRQRGPSFA